MLRESCSKLWFLLVFFSKSVWGCTNLLECFKTSRPGRIIANIVKVKNGNGYRDCYNDCISHSPYCQSFNYNRFTGYCELTGEVPAMFNIADDNGFIYSVKPDAEIIPDACNTEPCRLDNTVCFTLSTGEGTCIQECGFAEPTHGEAWSNMFSDVGISIQVTCNQGYTRLSPSVCLSSGACLEACVQGECTFEISCESLVVDTTTTGMFEIGSGPTQSDETGCTEDHTTGTGNYYYFDTSSPIQFGDTARMMTNYSIPAKLQVCITLWYHMWGAAMGQLSIKTKNSSGFVTSTQLIADGDQGTLWLKATKNITAQDQDYKIIIEGQRGTSSKSDICIDDIEIFFC